MKVFHTSTAYKNIFILQFYLLPFFVIANLPKVDVAISFTSTHIILIKGRDNTHFFNEGLLKEILIAAPNGECVLLLYTI